MQLTTPAVWVDAVQTNSHFLKIQSQRAPELDFHNEHYNGPIWRASQDKQANAPLPIHTTPQIPSHWHLIATPILCIPLTRERHARRHTPATSSRARSSVPHPPPASAAPGALHPSFAAGARAPAASRVASQRHTHHAEEEVVDERWRRRKKWTDVVHMATLPGFALKMSGHWQGILLSSSIEVDSAPCGKGPFPSSEKIREYGARSRMVYPSDEMSNCGLPYRAVTFELPRPVAPRHALD